MPQSLRFESLYALLEAKYKRVSFSGFINDHPYAYGILKTALMQRQEYEMLEVLENKKEMVDATFIIFMDNAKPILIKRANLYSEDDYKDIAELCCLSIEDINSVIENTA